MKKLTAIIMIFAMILTTSCPAYSDDKTDRFNQDSSYAFSPGYINAAKYQAEGIATRASLSDTGKKESVLDTVIDYVRDKLGYAARQQKAINTDLKPALRQKTSGINPEAPAAESPARLASSVPSEVKIGTGTDQRDVDGNLVSETDKVMMSEIIDGVRYNYAGFTTDTGDTIQAAVNRASAGDVVLVRESPLYRPGGIYTGFTITKGIKVYGGYDSNGRLAGTSKVWGGLLGLISFSGGVTVNGVNDAAHPVEISGFDSTLILRKPTTLVTILITLLIMQNFGGITVRDSSFVTISNCKSDGPWGLFVKNSTMSIYNSIINGTGAGIKATDSNITAVNNNIRGTGMWTSNVMFGISMPIYAGGGYGIAGSNSNFTLLNNNINNYYQVSSLSLTNNSQVSYNIKQADRFAQNTNVYSVYKPGYKSPYEDYSNAVLGQPSTHNLPRDNKGGAMLKQLIKSKEKLAAIQAGQLNPQLMAKILDGTLSQTLHLPDGQISQEAMKLAMRLVSILANPTEDQKTVIDSITSLLNDLENLQKETGESPELDKASSDLLQMVASVLLAQAIPDLLKEGDMANIKGIFADLDSSKTKMLLEYKEATRPYYEEVKKLIEKNASAIDIDINLKKLFEKEVPRSEIDKILEKLKAKQGKTFEEEYILQEQEKAKARYIDPNKKRLEEHMKQMLQDFTKKLSNTLETKK